ncbi:MAG: ABC transporter substrate-binding protein [Parvularculaceae bacterium]|jgi:phospholipid transport system substrate-binding protein|nr:ABC transporter substrate-binding protein [Parvularculaceae bacterium]
MLKQITRRTGLAVLVAAISLAAAPARADQAAEAFIAKILDEANTVFKSPDRAVRDAGIERLVDTYVDMKRVAMFALGQYARVITPAQKEIYFPLVRRYSTQIYQEALAEYDGQRLKVTGSVDRAANDIVVTSKFADVKPGEPFAETVFSWRVYRAADGTMSVVDAGADGIWLAIEQQSQFKSVIANNGGGVAGIDALIADLRRKVGGQPL